MCLRLVSIQAGKCLLRCSNTTTNIEEILIQVQKKLWLGPTQAVAVKTPLSWRKKLAGLTSGQEDEQKTLDSGAISPTLGSNDSSLALGNDMSHIIPGPKTTGWDEPGFYGISQDEGQQAPDLNSPDLTSLCEM